MANVGQADAAASSFITQIAGECPGVIAQAPEGQELDEVSIEVGAALGLRVIAPSRPAISTFLADTKPLRWSSRGVAGAVAIFETREAMIAAMTPPNLCGDLEQWASSRFTVIPEATRDLNAEAQLLFFPGSQVLVELERQESAKMRALVRRARRLESSLDEKSEPFVQRAGEELGAILEGRS
jgi:hypothetical protein